MVSKGFSPSGKTSRPNPQVELSRLRSLNFSLPFKPEDGRYARGTPSEVALDYRRLKSRRVPPTPNQNTRKKVTFQWVKGERLGGGSYAQVYLGLNVTTGEIMAVKQVELPQTASDHLNSRYREIIEALSLESQTLMDLDHINIVQYLGYDESPKYLSIFLEYVPGGTISSCLQNRGGGFNEEVTKSFTAQILEGLDYLHSKEILHRDLKSDNILVEPNGICKIADFGISKKTGSIEPRGRAYTAMKGTVYWMAPEVIRADKGNGYDVKVDIWSVGCIVLEMWTGERPWHGEEFFPVMMKLYEQKLPPPLPPDLPLSESASDFRRQCFRKHPNDRPSAKELKQHPYLVLPFGWRFELSDIERPHKRDSVSQRSDKSSKYHEAYQHIPSLPNNTQRLPATPPMLSRKGNPLLFQDQEICIPRQSHLHVPVHDRAEQDNGPPVVYITPPSSPSLDAPQIVAGNSRVSVETSAGVPTTVPANRKGFRIANPDPETETSQTPFVYTPPPLPNLGFESFYSSRLAPPLNLGATSRGHFGTSCPTNDVTSLSDICDSPRTELIRNVSSSASSSGRSNNLGVERSSAGDYSSSESDNNDGLWQKPPLDLAIDHVMPPPIGKSQHRIGGATGRFNTHHRDPLNRPHPAKVYDNLQNFFPNYDLDKVMVVDPGDSVLEGNKLQMKEKSIRMVAKEQSNLPRMNVRPKTKLWDGKLEELQMK